MMMEINVNDRFTITIANSTRYDSYFYSRSMGQWFYNGKWI